MDNMLIAVLLCCFFCLLPFFVKQDDAIWDKNYKIYLTIGKHSVDRAEKCLELTYVPETTEKIYFLFYFSFVIMPC